MVVGEDVARAVDGEPGAEAGREAVPAVGEEVPDAPAAGPLLESVPNLSEGRDPEVLAALRETGWRRPMTLEPFWTTLDATVTAAIGAATVRACWQAAGAA